MRTAPSGQGRKDTMDAARRLAALTHGGGPLDAFDDTLTVGELLELAHQLDG